MKPTRFTRLAIETLDDFVYGKAPFPVTCGHELEIGTGLMIPEINFTLPPMDISDATWPEVRRQYSQMIEQVCQRAVELEAPGLLVEFETLPPMTVRPGWGAEITTILYEELFKTYERHGLKNALRLTPNDTRDHLRPPLMRRGEYWEGMRELFELGPAAGADMLAIESTGGKEVCDEALMMVDLRTMVFALGVLASRDMRFLWREIVELCKADNVIASGDTACGFANTAMVLAEQHCIPRVFAAVVRVASVPRSLVAYEMGAVGPSKDCAYEGPYMKAIAGVPISMEGRSSACAHLTSVGNIAQAVCDCWSNESVQNVRLLSAQAPVVSLENLVYDCRLANSATYHSGASQRHMRDLLVECDSALDPQAYVLRPDVVLRLSREIIQEESDYLRTRRAVHATLEELRRAQQEKRLNILSRELPWLDKLQRQADTLPESEEEFIAEMLAEPIAEKFIPEEYELSAHAGTVS